MKLSRISEAHLQQSTNIAMDSHSVNDDDDVFEAIDISINSRNLAVDDISKQHASPTGYRGYQPPDEVLKLCQTDELESDEPVVHKVILLGDSGVGKTSLLVQFETGKFAKGNFAATVGIGFTNKTVVVDGNKVKLQIWDTAGQERFRSVTHAYYRDAHALLLLYDVTNKTSFDNIRAWLGEIREYAQDDVVIMLIGNKTDHSSNRAIQYADGARLAKEYNVIFMETSAKSGINVEVSFLTIARELCHRNIMNEQGQNASKLPTFNLQQYVHDRIRTETDNTFSCNQRSCYK